MKKKFRHHFSKNYFYGFLLFSSWFFLVFLAILACTGKNPFFALISVLFSLPCYFVVLYCAVLFLQPDEDENYTPYTSQTTVEGILDEKSRDGFLSIIHYQKKKFYRKYFLLIHNFLRRIFMPG